MYFKTNFSFTKFKIDRTKLLKTLNIFYLWFYIWRTEEFSLLQYKLYCAQNDLKRRPSSHKLSGRSGTA